MPIMRSAGCVRIVLGTKLFPCTASGAFPSVESLFMKIALAFPFANVVVSKSFQNGASETPHSCSVNALSPLRSDPDIGSNSGNSSQNVGAVFSTSNGRSLDNLVIKGAASRNIRFTRPGDSQAFLDTRGSGRRTSSPFIPCQKYEFPSSQFSSRAVEVGTEDLTRGKSWKGKGWNRAPTSEVVAVDSSTGDAKDSVSLQFDNIPDLEEKLKFLETCGLGDNQLVQMRKRLPSAVKNTFLKLSVKKLIEVATFLDEEVGVEKKDFGNLLFANPYIAGSSVDECLRPKVEFLRQRGITKEEMGKMVLRSPQILTYSLEGKLLAIEQKLLEVGLKDGEIGRVFVRYPALIGTSISKFDKNVQSLKEAGISEVARAIFKIPQRYSLSFEET